MYTNVTKQTMYQTCAVNIKTGFSLGAGRRRTHGPIRNVCDTYASCSILLQDRPRYSLHMRFMSINSSTQHGTPNKVSRIPTADPRFCYARGVVEMEADDTRGNPKNQKDAEVVRIVRSK